MNNLSKLYDTDIVENGENLYLSFSVGESKYAITTDKVVEIMKLPYLDYPQKLPNNFVGLLNYNSFTINILDLRFYLGINVTPYSVSNQLLIVKTDESIFGLLINKVENIFSMNEANVESISSMGNPVIIESFYHDGSDTVSIVNLYSLENMLKTGVSPVDVDIPALFPQDDESKYKFKQRNQFLIEKSKLDLAKNIFSQDKYISFSLNQNKFCINLEYIKEFLKNIQITRVPGAPDYIAGIMTLRGDFVTVVDLKMFLGLASDSSFDNCRVVIIETPDFKIGFTVDEIFSIVDVPEELINQSSAHQMNKYLLSQVVVDDELYTVLDMKKILSDERFYVEQKF